eukprot:9497919-Pyramimonas_sp.AAC.1
MLGHAMASRSSGGASRSRRASRRGSLEAGAGRTVEQSWAISASLGNHGMRSRVASRADLLLCARY